MLIRPDDAAIVRSLHRRAWRHCGRGALRTWSRKLVKPVPAGSALSFDAVLLSIGSSCTVPSVMNTVLMPEARSNDTDLRAGFCPVLESTGSGTRLGADAVASSAREAHSARFTSVAVRRSAAASGRVAAGARTSWILRWCLAGALPLLAV